ncbi:MAG: aminotransferase class V-fold PLP-dependent enzyme [Armatimonadota bacterium]
MTILEQLGVPSVVNAAGCLTRLGGSLMSDEVLAAMREAAQNYVPMDALQAAASRVIADVTGAEAGIVTSGAAAGLLLGAAACITGLDPQKMNQLPDTTGMRSEVVIQKGHRDGYDHAVRATGARLVEIGMPYGTRAYELRSALSERTAAVLYIVARSKGIPLSLDETIQIAHERGVPVIVDAAAELPPADNLRRFIAAGADLVAFSGGKAIMGPQTSGILCGRRDLITAAALQMLDMDVDAATWAPPAGLATDLSVAGPPEQGIGRALKVGKEEIVGLLVALRAYAGRDHTRDLAVWDAMTKHVQAELKDSGLAPERVTAADSDSGVPLLRLRCPAGSVQAREMVSQLHRLETPIHLGEAHIHRGVLVVNPVTLKPGQERMLADAVGRIWREMSGAASRPGSSKSPAV